MNLLKRPFGIFSISQSLNQFGSSLTNLAFVLWIMKYLGSGVALGWYFLLTTFVTAFISAFAGTFIDSFDRKKILIACDLLGLISVGLLLGILRFSLPDSVTFFLIISVKILLSAAYAVRTPTLNTLTPALTDQSNLVTANAWLSASRQIAMIFSEALGGFLFSSFGMTTVLALDLITYFAAVYFSYTFLPSFPNKSPATVNTTVRQKLVDNLIKGWRVIFRARGLRSFGLYILCVNIFYAPIVVWVPFYMNRSLSLSLAWSGYATASISAGVFLGALAISRKAIDKMSSYSVLIGILLLIGFAFAVLGFNANPYVACLLFFVIGALTGAFNVRTNVLIQRKTRPYLHGRIFSGLFAISFLVSPFMKGVSGSLLEIPFFNAKNLFLISGVFIILMTIIFSRSRSLSRFLGSAQRANTQN